MLSCKPTFFASITFHVTKKAKLLLIHYNALFGCWSNIAQTYNLRHFTHESKFSIRKLKKIINAIRFFFTLIFSIVKSFTGSVGNHTGPCFIKIVSAHYVIVSNFHGLDFTTGCLTDFNLHSYCRFY